MIAVWIIIGLTVGLVVGLLAYHFYFKHITKTRLEAENKMALHSYEKDQLDNLHVKIAAERDRLIAEAHQRASDEYDRLVNSYRSMQELAETEQRKIEKLRLEQTSVSNSINTLNIAEIDARNSLENYRKAVTKLYKSALEDGAHNYELEDAKLRLIYAGKEEGYKVSLAADEANLQVLDDLVEERSENARCVLAYRDSIVHGDEPGFKLRMSEQAIFELTELWKAIRGLRLPNPAPLFKACFELYLRTPIKDAFSGIAPGGGIYAITDLTTNLVYVGQTTNFKDRWLTHLKRGSFYEEGTAAGSTLYSAMKEHGVWNFRFEVLQEVEDEEKLRGLEKTWISKLGTIEHGLNMKAGG